MLQLDTKQKRLITLAEKKGNNADLVILDALHEVEDEVGKVKTELTDKVDAVSTKVDEVATKFDETVKQMKADAPDLNKVLDSIKGKDGEQGIQGEKPTDEELIALIEPLIPEPIPGKDGKEGADGLDGENGKDGLDGKDPDENVILDRIEKDLPKLGNAIRDSLELLQDEERLDSSAIKGLEKILSTDGKPTQMFGGGRPLVIQGLGVVVDKNTRVINFKGTALTAVTRTKNGIVNVTFDTAAVGTPVSEEIPTDSGDHTNFTLAHTPIAGTFKLYRGGSRQQSVGVTPDYTRVGTALALTTILDSADGEVLFCDYSY